MRPAAEAGLTLLAGAAALYMRPVLDIHRNACCFDGLTFSHPLLPYRPHLTFPLSFPIPISDPIYS